MLIYIDTGFACFGVEIDHSGIIVDAPPIVKWSTGKHLNKLKQYVDKFPNSTIKKLDL